MTLEEAIRILRSPEGREETKRVYLLRRAVDWAEITIRAGDVTRDDAEAIVDAVAARAQELFPGSSGTFAIVYGVRLKRVIDEVFGQSD
ncbi:MAG TPA: hypothetical protein VN894_20930 [Polyangiaceae bacterium]|jgi:hypothetical protein|nr:hypothetical protein [Polyangiaceae bacterium]